MAAQTQINVNVKVDDKQVNSAVKSTENLRKEIKRLEVELTKVEIGSKEFENLSEQLKDNRDKLDLVRAKSRDLFDSFSMLPGPIGQIGSSVTSASDKLKIFTSFNLKDVKGQFKAIGDDIKLVGGNIGKATGITKLYEATTNGLGKAFKFLGVGVNTASTAAKGFGKALIGTGIGAIVVAVGALIANFDSLKATLMKLIPGLSTVANAIQGMVNWFTDLIGVTSEAERAEARRQATYAKAKAATDIVNQGIQRQINLLQAQGASQDEIDKKRKQIITNEINDLKKAANERGVLYGEQATKFKDLQNQLEVINAEGEKRRQDKADQDAKAASSKGEANRQKELQRQKEFLQSQADAEVQLIKDQEDTKEDELRNALKKQYDLKNEGKTLSVEVQKQQAAEIDRIVKEELEKDKETRKKAFDDRIKASQDAGKIELDSLSNDIEAKRLKYGEDSKAYRDALQARFDKQKEILDKEEAILKEKENTKDGLTEDEKNRLRSIVNERQALTNEIKKTNDEQLKSDQETAQKKLDDQKRIRDEEFTLQMNSAGMDFELQKQIINDKLKADEEYFDKQEELYKDNQEKLDEIDRQRLANKQSTAKQLEDIRKAEVDLQIRAADAVVNAFGQETAAGKAALLAKQFILAKELFLEAKRTLAFSKAAITRSKVAVAEGSAQTVKVGFPQNIPLLILYAAQAASIISAVISAAKSSNEAESEGTNEQPRKLASGGIVKGPGSGRSDMVPAMLSNGESVINAESTAMFKPLLSSINAIGGGRRFAEGGLAVGGFSQDQALKDLQNTLSSQTPPIKTYVVSSDMSNQQMMDRAIKSRSTL